MLKPDHVLHQTQTDGRKTATNTPTTRLVDKITPVARLADNVGDFILNVMSGGRR